MTLLILCCFGVQDLRLYHVKCVYLRKVLDGSLKDTINTWGNETRKTFFFYFPFFLNQFFGVSFLGFLSSLLFL